jgi:peptide/nickel transport system substrate-binding protein
MAKKLIVTIIALVGIIAMVLPGCGDGGGPQPVTIKMLIRNSDLRLDIGDYVGNQLQALGFKVDRRYGTGSELGPIYLGDPTPGEWNVYTGAWLSTAVSRDEGSNFGFFYTPLGAYDILWDYYRPSYDFYEVSKSLYFNDFNTMEEREELFEDAVPLSMQDSIYVWLNDRAAFSPLSDDIAVASDAYGGIEGSGLWAYTMHFRDGGGTPLLPDWDSGVNGTLTAKIALEDLIVDPWNPVMGSNWAFDQFPNRATQENGFEYDTRDGLVWPGVAQKADIVVKSGLPIGLSNTSTGWCTLNTSPGLIAVPTTAWADWNATSQTWLTAGPGKTAKSKTVVYYPEGTFGRPLHDGSSLSEADFLLYAIMMFDRGKTGSDLYDSSYVPSLTTFLSHFKGVEFNFTAPGYDLVVTTYDDTVLMDAELYARLFSWFPSFQVTSANVGQWVWHNVALGILAERDHELGFSNSKASNVSGDWLSFIAGPSLAHLADHLADVRNPANLDYRFLPYPNILGPYVNNATIDARYQNLQWWYGNYTHFWVGSGPYFLYDVDATADKLELHAFTSYTGNGSKYFFVMDPVPVSPPAHNGAWLDVVTLEVEDDHTAGVSRLQSDDFDVYAAGLTEPDLFETVAGDPDLHYYLYAGLFDCLAFNPSGLFFPGSGKLNPFSIPEIREAMNWAIDRDHIVGEIYGGMALPRYTCVGALTGDYINRYPALFAATEADYAYNFALANSTIYAEMMAINGTSYTGGKYYYTEP